MTAFRLAVVALSLGATICSPARAFEIDTGTEVICDTRGQAERLAALLDRDAHAAVMTVNTEVKDPTACALVNVAYVRGAKVGTARSQAGTFDIVEILAVGVVTRRGLRPTNPATYFTLFKVAEQGA